MGSEWQQAPTGKYWDPLVCNDAKKKQGGVLQEGCVKSSACYY